MILHRHKPDRQDHPYLRALQGEIPGSLVLYGAMLAIWHMRPATQRRFPLQRGRERDKLRFLAWCATDGRKDYAILREIPVWDEDLNRPVNLPQLKGDRWTNAHSLGTFLHGVTVHRWSLSGMMKSAWARDLAAKRFWGGALLRNNAPKPMPWQRKALIDAHGSSARLARTVAMKEDTRLSDSDLLAVLQMSDFDAAGNETKALRPPPIDSPADLHLSPIPLPQPLMRLLEPIVQLARQSPSHAESVGVMSRIDTTPQSPRITHGVFGVNLIGFARGELGIGEDIRQVALALAAAGIPVCILDFAPGKNISQSDDTAARLMSDEPLYGINIFCLTGIETTRYICERGLSTVEGRYNIGLWPWELPDWPENCRHAYACVDEIWGISNYTANAHRFAAPRPVIRMGLPVELGPIGLQTRADFGLPEQAYLFAFAFDVSSSAERKNPEGLIRAFQKAFPNEPASEVGLVLKVSHAETRSKLWRKIRSYASRDPRIHIIERTMRRREILALMKVCDCYVSLHRGEGFGRCLAEALLLDKQLIATGFSGNMDFCREPRVALVRHAMRPVQTGEYMWSEGQSWAEPDIDHAAELMRSVRDNPRDTKSRDFDFSPATVGARYASRLREIWAQHGPATSAQHPTGICSD